METYTSPKSRDTKMSDSKGQGEARDDQHYGTHFEEYTNLNDIEDSSDDQYASRHNIKGYGSAGGGATGYSQNQQHSTHYMSESRGSGDIGTSSRGQTYQSSAYRQVDYSGIGGGGSGSHHTV